MLLIRLLAASAVVMTFAAVPDTARAATDVWGCNYDKCVSYCTKMAGKHCTTYCERRLQDKRCDKVCK